MLAAQGRQADQISLEEIDWLGRLRRGMEKTRQNFVTTLLENLHLPKAHYEESTCPMVCGQKQNCHRICETMSLVDLIVAELGKRFKVFEGMDIAMIGSTREGSRAFFYDEVDVHLSLNKDFKKFSYFDAKQMVLKRDPSRAENPEDCDKYFDENNFLKPDLYFHDFVASVHSIISTLELPEDFAMLPLTTSFTPCTRCMTAKHKGLQVMRCRHKADCEQHKRCSTLLPVVQKKRRLLEG